MTSIVAALKAHDNIRTLAEPIYQFSFTFVAPLGANHDDIRHF